MIDGVLVTSVQVDGALELTAGAMGDHFASKGIAVQKTAPHTHTQNGKSKCYIHTLEEGCKGSTGPKMILKTDSNCQG